MIFRNNPLHGIVLLISLFLLVSCMGKKQLIINERPVNTKKLIKSITSNVYAFNNILVKKLSIRYEEKEKQLNVKGSLAIINDSLINIKIIPALGILAFDLIIKKDSVILIDKIKKDVYTGSLSQICDVLKNDFSFIDIQNILLDNIIIQDDKYYKIINKRTEVIDGLHVVESIEHFKKLNKVINVKYFINNDEGKIEKVEIFNVKEEKLLKIQYTDFQIIDGIKFLGAVSLKVNNNGGSVNLTLEYNKIELNQNNEVKFNIPGNYDRKLLKSLF